MNTGTARIIIVLALIAGGAVVLLNGFADSGDAAAASGGNGGGTVTTPTDSSTPPTTTKSTKPPAPETPKPAKPGDTVVAVFNGTEIDGLGATVNDDILDQDGYLTPQDPDDAPTGVPLPKTIVYYVGGADAAQNQSDATAMSDKYFDGAKVEELDPAYSDLIDRGVQVVVVVGEDSKYAPA